jgi:hypothetical protein
MRVAANAGPERIAKQANNDMTAAGDNSAIEARRSVIKVLTVIAVVALIAYLVAPWGDGGYKASWGAIRVGCLLLDVASIMALMVLLVRWSEDLSDMPGRRIVLVICVVNWAFFLILTYGLIMFL